jgi:uncharacterized protein (TIGR02118 family)
MIKVFSLLKRREDWTRDQFKRWWLDEHIAYAKKLPGLRKYRVCLTSGSTTHEGNEPFDGVAELWFDNRAALEAAWASPIGLEAVGHSKANVSDRVVLITEEHEIL